MVNRVMSLLDFLLFCAGVFNCVQNRVQLGENDSLAHCLTFAGVFENIQQTILSLRAKLDCNWEAEDHLCRSFGFLWSLAKICSTAIMAVIIQPTSCSVRPSDR